MSGPLTPCEVREGLDRLLSRRFMRAGRDGDYTDAVDWTSEHRSNSSGALFGAFADDHGIPGNAPGVIEDLAVAFVLSRSGLTQEQLFRLGTSEEAIRLFEESDEWKRRTARGSNLVAFPGRVRP